MENCLFCKIISGEIPSKKVYEDEICYAFYDINPQTPVHVLVVPKKHIENLKDAAENYSAENEAILGHIQITIGKLAKELGLSESGFRVISNCGKDACQSVFHLHYHILGGAQMSEQMA